VQSISKLTFMASPGVCERLSVAVGRLSLNKAADLSAGGFESPSG